jgi:Cu-Zn family superoxide dismutase
MAASLHAILPAAKPSALARNRMEACKTKGRCDMSTLRQTLSLAALSLSLLLLIACARKEEERPQGEAATPAAETQEALVAKATLRPSTKASVNGTVTFTQSGNMVTVVAHVEGAKPGLHGFHVHEVGDCTAVDFSSAGNHFNPGAMQHGAPEAPSHHAGDLGNITVGPDGIGHLEIKTSHLTVADGPNSVVGRAVILHEAADDLTTQPGGNAGAREACGVVEMATTAH